MMSEQQITEKLEQLGYKQADIRLALRDVGQLIVGKTAAAYLATLPSNIQNDLRSLSEEDVRTYLVEHQGSLPKMQQEDFEKIHDETWGDYFRSVA